MADDQHDDQDTPVEIELTPNELNQGLLAAAKLGKVPLVLQTLAKGADLSFIDNRVPGNWTPLHFAAYYGHYRVVDILLRHGAANKYREYIENIANDPLAPRVRCYNSPLSWAVIRGHLRCVWLLLNAGYSPMDVDTNGNNCLHLAAACLAPNPSVQLEMIKTIMYQGCDPDVRNWLGQRAIDMLTKKSKQYNTTNANNDEAVRLLTLAANTTKCASSGTTFGADQLRYLCFSTHQFFCEEASVEKKIPAFALAKPGVTVHDFGNDNDTESSNNSSNIRDIETIKRMKQQQYKDIELVHYGIAQGIGAIPVTRYKVDLQLVRPVRYGAEISYRIADAEANLENVLNPFPEAVQKALETAGYTVPGTGAVNTKIDDGANISSPSAPSIVPYDFELELYITAENIQALENAVSQVRELRGDVQLVARGMSALTRLRAANSLREAVTMMLKKRPVEDAVLTDNLSTAINIAKQAGVGETLIRQAQLALRIGLAEIEVIGATMVCNAITVGTHLYDADIGRLQSAINEANKASAEAVRIESGGDIFEEPVEVKPPAVADESKEGSSSNGGEDSTTDEPGNPDNTGSSSGTSETNGNADSSSSSSSSTEGSNNADNGGSESKEDNSSASGTNEESNPTADEASSSSSASSNEGVSASSDEIPSSSSPTVSTRIIRPRLDIPVLSSNIIHLSPVHNTVMETGNALLSRLVCEVKVTDSIDVAENSFTKVTEVVERHKEEDPTLLPVPEKPVEPEAIPPPSRPPSGKGGKAPAPAPAPADATPPVATPPDPAFPCDSAGVPLPDSPQLLAIKALRDACTNLDTIIQESRTAGADAACIANAENALNRLRNELMTSLQTETTRVEFYRAERAKLEKKNKKKKK